MRPFLTTFHSSTKEGKKVTVVADVWSLAKKKPEKNPGLNLNKYKKPNGKGSKDKIMFKEGIKVTWIHPKAGKGSATMHSVY